MGVDVEEEVTPFMIDIKEVAYGFSFYGLPMLNPDIVEVYMNELKVCIYIKSFMRQ